MNTNSIAGWGVALALALASTGCDQKKNPEVEQLKTRVAALEKRLDKIEGPIQASAQQDERRKAMQESVNHRFQLDKKKYTQQQMTEIENLYQQVSKTKFGSPECLALVNKLAEQYPDSDRAGCAMLYLAQGTDGPDAEKYFQACIQKFNGCFYGDGVQVGVLARFFLATYYHNNGLQDKAAALFQEIKDKYPDAVDHGGQLLVDQIK